MKFIITILTLMSMSAQTLTYQYEVQEPLPYDSYDKEWERAVITKVQKSVISIAVMQLVKDYGLIINEIDANLDQILFQDLKTKNIFTRFILTQNKVIRSKLFVTGTLYFEQSIFVKFLKEKFEKDLEKMTYSEEKLRFEIAEIISYRDKIFNLKKSNSDTLLSIIKLGMSRQEVFDVMLFFNERKLRIDVANSVLLDDKKKRLYHVKNTYIQLIFDLENKQLIEIKNLTPQYN